ncbi:hypothetical protein HYW17_00595 [Candidatus Uhrbacteria bacterium]|nr:hypothetical protein [Candidatus Uhrbacteria bacterium]
MSHTIVQSQSIKTQWGQELLPVRKNPKAHARLLKLGKKLMKEKGWQALAGRAVETFLHERHRG